MTTEEKINILMHCYMYHCKIYGNPDTIITNNKQIKKYIGHSMDHCKIYGNPDTIITNNKFKIYGIHIPKISHIIIWLTDFACCDWSIPGP